jgi:outer membrane receptor for ferrienterochelin and colicin
MESQQQTSSALLASNVSTMVSSQNKSKTTASKFFTNINHHSYNKQLVWNRFASLSTQLCVMFPVAKSKYELI